MNSPVLAALQKVIDSRTTGTVFDYLHTGVSASTLRHIVAMLDQKGAQVADLLERSVIGQQVD